MAKNNKIILDILIKEKEIKIRKLNNLKPTKFFKDKTKYNRKEFKLNKKSLDSFSFYILNNHRYLTYLRVIKVPSLSQVK